MAEITVIPAKNRTDEIIRTAAYARVSSDSEDQLNSFAAQIRYYTELLSGSIDMVFVDMYADVEPTQWHVNQSFRRICSKYQQAVHTRRLSPRVHGLLFGL